MRPGDTLDGRFRVEGEAGSGGMGVVFRAADLVSGEPVAIKVLKADRAEVTRFQREARVLSQLRHPAIVRYVAHGATAAGTLYLAMEWLEGEDLSDRLLRGPLGVADALQLARRIADALAAAHARGIVHRDLKPQNLFLPSGDVREVKLLDFGIARVQNATAAMTQAGAILGTPGYMAPEQARGEILVDARCDVFALGCVLFECLAGRAAFTGDNLVAMLAKILMEEVPRVSELRPGLHAAIDDLVLRMLEKSPASRPADGGACRDAILAVEGLADALDAGAVSARRSAITRGEQHLVSVVIAGGRAGEREASTEVIGVEEGPSISIRFEELVSLDAVTALTVPGRGAAACVAASSGGVAVARTELAEPAVQFLARFGARVERLADGAIVASLHGTGAATDQAAQAARCALALRRLVPGSPIVLATGRAIFAGRLPIGAVIERAAKLLKQVPVPLPPAGEGPILVDDVTAGLLPSRFRLRQGPLGVELAGEEEGADVPRTVLGRTLRFVGRDAEMGTLTGLYAQVEQDGVARAVVIAGAPGVGKSRLREELILRLRAAETPPAVWMGSAEPLGAVSPYGIVRRVLRHAAGNGDRDHLVTRISRAVPTADARRVATFLAELAGTPLDAAPALAHAEAELAAARREPPLMAEQVERAFVDFVRAECAARPVVAILEDAHWADMPSMRLVDVALRELAESALLVVAFARPEIEAAFPGLFAERNALKLSLGALTARAAERLARDVLGDKPDREAVGRIVAQAAGNPFFLEELLRASAGGAAGTLPETVLAIVQKRLEAFDEDARRVLRAASVFGGVFWRGAPAALLGVEREELDGRLRELVEREVLVRHPSSRFADETEYAFRHAFLRDAAYQMLTDADRTLGHRFAGEWLEGAGESNQALLAEHFERGGDSARATRSYALAAAQALHADDLDGCLGSAKKGLRLADAGDAGTRGALHLTRAEAHQWRAEWEDAYAESTEALHLLERASDGWLGAIAIATSACATTGRTEEALAHAAELAGEGGDPRSAFLVAAAQCAAYLPPGDAATALLKLLPDERTAGGDALLLARVHVARATHAQATGDPAAVLDEFTRAAIAFERAGHRRGARAARGNAGYASTELGRHEEAEALLRAAIEEARQAGALGTVGWTAMHLGMVVGRLGRGSEALSLLREAGDLARRQGNRRLEAEAAVATADVLNASGAHDLAADAADKALGVAAEIPALRATALAALSEARRQLGDAAAARAMAEAASEILATHAGVDEVEPAVRLAFAEALYALGDLGGARAAAEVAKRAVLARAASITDPGLRRTFLERVPVNARILRLHDGCWVIVSA